MNEFNQDQEIIDVKTDSNSKKVLVIVGVVVLIAIIFGVFKFINRDNPSDSNENIQLSQEDDAIVSDDGLEGVLGDGNNSNVASVIGSANGFSKVKLAVLAGDFYDVSFGGKKVGCDNVVMVDQFIEPTRAPLNSAMRALFEFDVKTDFLPGNFISTQSNLNFVEAKIEGGVAEIFLTGSLGPIAGDCDKNRVQTQIKETALQFKTVNSVNIFLNGEILN